MTKTANQKQSIRVLKWLLTALVLADLLTAGCSDKKAGDAKPGKGEGTTGTTALLTQASGATWPVARVPHAARTPRGPTRGEVPWRALVQGAR